MVLCEQETNAQIAQGLLCCAPAASISKPKASKVSAAPAFDEAARLPCFATGTPQAATTRLTAVDTLSVWCPSPPVPQTSIAFSGASIGIKRARKARAAPAISSSVSPRSDKSIRKRSISASGTSPSSKRPKASSASAALRWASIAGRVLMSGLSPRCRISLGNWLAVHARTQLRCSPGGTGHHV